MQSARCAPGLLIMESTAQSSECPHHTSYDPSNAGKERLALWSIVLEMGICVRHAKLLLLLLVCDVPMATTGLRHGSTEVCCPQTFQQVSCGPQCKVRSHSAQDNFLNQSHLIT